MSGGATPEGGTPTGQPRPRRRLLVGLIIPVLIVLGLAGAYQLATTTGPSPRLAEVALEPILVAPVEMDELGRQTRQSEWGLGMGPDSTAYVAVAFQADASPADAIRAWTEAYGQEYGLALADDPTKLLLTGGTDDVVVRVIADNQAFFPQSDPELPSPAPGATVVTVYVGGRS